MRPFGAVVAALLVSSAGGQAALALTFAEAGAAAEAASGELRADRAALALREGAWLLSLRAYFPRLSLSAAEDDRLSAAGADSFAKSFGAAAEQLLWDGGAVAAARALERAELAYARAELGRKARAVSEAAVSAYRGALVAGELAAVKRASAAHLLEQRRILAAEAAAGLARQDELAEADIAVGNAELASLGAALDAEEAEIVLAEALSAKSPPPLTERIDTERRPVELSPETVSLAVDRARAVNADIAAARLELLRKGAALRSAAAALSPTLSLVGGVRVSGDRYPLTRASWSLGLNLEFSGSFFGGSGGAGIGGEPPFERSANASATIEPFPDPGAALGVRNAEAALALERERFGALVERTGRRVEAAAKRLRLLGRRLELARSARGLSRRRLELRTLELSLGRAARIDAMEARVEADSAAAALVEAAAALTEGERELERLLELQPGGLAGFAAEARRGRTE